MTFTRIISDNVKFTPLCPNCNKKMEIKKAMNGKHWYCPDYAYCGGRIDRIEDKEEGVRNKDGRKR